MSYYPDFDEKAVGRRIQKRRRAVGIKTQARLGEILYHNEDTIQKWETGGQSIKLHEAAELANALHCDIDYLLGVQEEPTHEIDDLTELTGLSGKAADALISIANSYAPALSAILESKSGLKLIEDICKYISFPEQSDYCMTVNTPNGEQIVEADPFYIAFNTDYLSADTAKAWYMPEGLKLLFSRINTDELKDFTGTAEIYGLLEEEYPLIIQQDLTKARSETSRGRLERLKEIAENIEKKSAPERAE